MTREEFWQKKDDEIDRTPIDPLREWAKRLTRDSFSWSDKYFQLLRKFEEMEVELSKCKSKIDETKF